MKFDSSALNDSVATLLGSSDNDERAHGANVAVEKRVSDRRRRSFEAVAVKHGDVPRGVKAYVKNRVNVLHGVPATFHADNDGALLTTPGQQTLVRVEKLNTWVDGYFGPKRGIDEFVRLEGLWRRGDAVGIDGMNAFFKWWNEPDQRDRRPLFAAFLSDIGTVVADGANWAEDMRAQLGLGHLKASDDMPVLVAQMRYSVAEVQAMASGSHGLFAAPTVIDMELTPYFFPSPKPLPGQSPSYGRTVHLRNEDKLVCEVLHQRIDYRPEHLHELFTLTTNLPEPALSNLDMVRIHHLERLRQRTKQPTFGEEIQPVSSVVS